MKYKVLIETAVFVEAKDALEATDIVENFIKNARGNGRGSQQLIANCQVITAEEVD